MGLSQEGLIIMLNQDRVHCIRIPNVGGNVVMKLDITKAYNIVN